MELCPGGTGRSRGGVELLTARKWQKLQRAIVLLVGVFTFAFSLIPVGFKTN